MPSPTSISSGAGAIGSAILGAGATALSVASAVETMLIIASAIFKVCVKVSEALHKVKSNSKAAEALQIRVTSVAMIVNSKLSAKQTTDVEMNTMNSLLKTLNETSEWVEKRIEKEATQLTLHQLWKAKDTEDKIKAFDERLSNHMIDLNVAQSVALDFKAAQSSYEMQGLIQYLNDSQRTLAEELRSSNVWSLDNAVERLGGIEKVITDGLNNVGADVFELKKQNEEILHMLKQNQKVSTSTISQPQSPKSPLSTLPSKLISWSDLKGTGDEIAHGAFGVVRRYTFLGAAVAVKELTGANALSMKQKEQFLTEASIQARLTHPYVVRVYGIVHDEKTSKYGIVLHLMGQGLDKYIEGHSLSLSIRIEYIRQIAAGIAYLHNEDPVIIHGDIKPQNVLVAEGNLTVGLTDFGLARTKAQLGMSTSAGGGLKGVGTLPYMAPELFETDTYGQRKTKTSKTTDVYAFGITAFCILIGHCGLNGPYPDEDEESGEDTFNIIKAVVSGKRPSDFVQWPTEVPEIIKTIIIQCWVQDANKRMLMKDVVEKLEEGVIKDVKKETDKEGHRQAFVPPVGSNSTLSSPSSSSSSPPPPAPPSAHVSSDSASKPTSPPKILAPTPPPKKSSDDDKAPDVLPKDAVELVKLLKLESVKKDAKEVRRVSNALSKIAETIAGHQSCIDAGAPLALTNLAKEKAVKENGDAAWYVALALKNIADSESGRQSCIDAGASLVLTNLAKEKAVKENGSAAAWVAFALGNISSSESGRQSCIDAGAPLALTDLAKEKAVKENGEAAANVAWALGNISSSESGRQSCIDAGAPLVLTNLAKEKAVKENGSAAAWVAYAIGNIAKSESGRQSCIDAGAPLALTDLAKEKAVKENGTAASNVASALRNIAESESGRQSCIDAGAPLALTDLAKEEAVKENGTTANNVASALGIIAESESGRQSCIDAGAPLALTNLAKVKAVKENGEAAANVAFALGNIAESESGRQSCIDAGASLVLTDLAKEKAVKENWNAANNVALALGNIA
jgi:serine/threonine protein kinase